VGEIRKVLQDEPKIGIKGKECHRSGSTLKESCIAKRITRGYIDLGSGSTLEETCIAKSITSGYIDEGSGGIFYS
jgi:hypothetical protein